MPNNKKQMYDKNAIVTGLVIFVIIMTIPIWYNIGRSTPPPEPKISDKAKAAKDCIAPGSFMKAEHMQILGDWRDAVVRDADRLYVAPNGKEYTISLSTGEDSCMGCHVSKADFCDKCHDYASVDPYCWDCHIEPKENK
ncbi:Sulfate reduction electron transfer complex DsrMKJOP subunit DsrJ [Candidatus Magnetomoraceae bacterium gMMP-15]